MNKPLIFDTHACVKRMTSAGVETHVAEAFAAEQVNILEHHIATKTDVAVIQKDIELLRKDTHVAIAQIEAKLTKAISGAQFKTILWLGGYITIFVTVAKFL